jgi:hypothetical protein
MTGFKGRFILKQYIPGKPIKWGIKAWGIADSITGYLLKCKIYFRKKEKRNCELLLGQQVVIDMTEDYKGLWHHVYFDISFTSTKLMKLLLERKSYACGTAHARRKDRPKEFCKPKQLKLSRGKSRKLQHEDMTAVVWHDNWDVLLLSTNSDPRTDDKVMKGSGRGRAVVNYTQKMGDVDISDQKIEYYGVGQPSKNGGNIFFTL